ncbi:unnamed protein product [Sphenostylis stenocarpa]|uniref:Uncharacterized protein n=1 Tax=Sphenostylis stenocarpa TaxID=92480 RepID=A0AA86RMR9_9FABA|nr:unnamed protein product [Sphenostylis stenocarpa]
MLEYIDVSDNQINDSFPCWLRTLPELKVVALLNNHLYGSIRCPTTFTFPKLHIIDLSRNQLSGSLSSKAIQNCKSMKALVLLNLSNNMLFGSIPSLGKLSNLEVLDLSLNSHIPQNKQFATFPHSSFEGNQELCVNPLVSKCEYDGGSLFAPGTLPELQVVAMGDNNLYGSIRDGHGYAKLQEFYYLIAKAINGSSNKFYADGEIPDVIGDLQACFAQPIQQQ